MVKAISTLLIILLSIGAYAFDQAPELYGKIARPGYDNLQVEENAAKTIAGIGSIYSVNLVAGTPRAASLQYQSKYSAADSKALAGDFISNNQDLIKVSSDQFRLGSSKLILGKYYFINMIQTYNDVDIYGSRLGLRATPEGKIYFTGGEIFTGIDIDTNPAFSSLAAEAAAQDGIVFDTATDKTEYVKLVILPLIYDDKIEYRLCHQFLIITTNPVANWRTFVDAQTGEAIWREDITRYETISGTITGMIQPSTPYDEYVESPMPNNYVYNSSLVAATTDSYGNYSFDVSDSGIVYLNFFLEGPYLNIWDMNEEGAQYSVGVYPGDTFNLVWNDTNSTIPQHDAFYHGQVVHDYIKALDPDLTVMDFSMPCRVNVDGSCNAYYSYDRSINFYEAGGNCPNIAQIADVVYHEWGHGLTNITYYEGGSSDPNDAMHEGFSDILAALVTNQPYIGLGFYGPGTHIRNVDNDNRYPDDWSGESHNDGLIISGALWDLKQMLDEEHPHYIDTLWQYGKYGYAYDFEDYFFDVLALDDDDGDLDNGTPHAYEIYYSFGELHGIGPGVPIEIFYTPVIDSEDSTVVYPIEVVASSDFSMDQGGVVIHYSTGGDYSDIDMVNISGDDWYAEIPAQHFGTTVNYYIEAIDNMNLRRYAPEDAPDSIYTFYVGFDLTGPEITDANGQAPTIDLFSPYGPFSFQAEDVHEIDPTSGLLYYKVNDGEESQVTMSFDEETSEFSIESIDLNDVLQVGDVVNYYFTCRDLALNNNLGRYPDSGYLNFAMAYSEVIGDFEDSLSGWTVEGEGWVFFDGQGYLSNYCIKTGESYYSDNAYSIIYRTQPINCTLFNGVWLEFRYKVFMLDGDSVYVVAANSADGPWTSFGGLSGTSRYWTDYSIALDGMSGTGNDSVYVGLKFVSDASGNYFGMLADQLTIYVQDPTGIETIDNIPQAYSLNQNYPNPFNMNTIISFTLAQSQDVTLDIFDILGRRVKRLMDSKLAAGSHQIIWNGQNESGESITSGIYFYRLEYGDNREIKSMTLIK